MEIIFSPGQNKFFPVQLKPDYEVAGTWPTDGIGVSYEVYLQFTASPPEGKVRVVVNGLPAWGDIPAPTHEQQVASAVQKRNSLRTAADSEIIWLQDAVDAGIATDEETALLAAWKSYRVQLMRIDTSKAPYIEWPTSPTVGN